MSHWVVNVFWQARALVWAVLRQMLLAASSPPLLRLHSLWKLLGNMILYFLFQSFLLQKLIVKHSEENIEIRSRVCWREKWSDSGKEIFSWPPAFMEQKPAETLNVPPLLPLCTFSHILTSLHILTQRIISPLIAHVLWGNRNPRQPKRTQYVTR